ncbi:hypothetical protein LTSEURB_1960, partial [Salmonella enterica subsp. enterica serovar Urbana str. R8-2977]
MNEAVINTGKPDNHIIIRAHRFCRRGRFWRLALARLFLP